MTKICFVQKIRELKIFKTTSWPDRWCLVLTCILFFKQLCVKIHAKYYGHFGRLNQKFLPRGVDRNLWPKGANKIFVVVPFLVTEIEEGEIRDPESVRHYVQLPMPVCFFLLTSKRSFNWKLLSQPPRHDLLIQIFFHFQAEWGSSSPEKTKKQSKTFLPLTLHFFTLPKLVNTRLNLGFFSFVTSVNL